MISTTGILAILRLIALYRLYRFGSLGQPEMVKKATKNLIKQQIEY
jgi:hypothetical protein